MTLLKFGITLLMLTLLLIARHHNIRNGGNPHG